MACRAVPVTQAWLALVNANETRAFMQGDHDGDAWPSYITLWWLYNFYAPTLLLLLAAAFSAWSLVRALFSCAALCCHARRLANTKMRASR